MNHRGEAAHDSTESSDSGSSFGTRERGGDSTGRQGGGRGYIRVPTQEAGAREDSREAGALRKEHGSRWDYLASI